jgi:hypothetical protein
VARAHRHAQAASEGGCSRRYRTGLNSAMCVALCSAACLNDTVVGTTCTSFTRTSASDCSWPKPRTSSSKSMQVCIHQYIAPQVSGLFRKDTSALQLCDYSQSVRPPLLWELEAAPSCAPWQVN